METKRNNYNNIDSLWSTLWDLGYQTSQGLAYSVGMPNFSFGAFILLSVMTWCCFFMPPVAVFFRGYLRDGNACTEHVIYNIILCFFLWVPGMVHAFWYCFSDMFTGPKKEGAGYSKNA
ncbi:hypothetical protein niasHT_014760 [Heterodera trifolii]|uniref:Uncharacterized protein n=1 Tax=Heterodera trifolii TaxID=157864 RepID=A0ABD2L6P4_9BILA